nr:putative ribonuclease H-like domain-containing protein [Tanacetum cinerariifolium]
MDLFGPTSVSSISHKWYCLVVTDDFFRFTWTFFLKTKDETSGILRYFITEIENLKELKVKIIRCDNRGEFRNKKINDFYSRKGIKREFSNARTPQQNGVAERRNGTLIEAPRTMLADAKLPVTFWTEAVNTACYVQNRVLVNKSQNKTSYELFNGRTPTIGFLKPFGCHVMILNTLDSLVKFEAKEDEGCFIGYFMSSKAFRVFNKRTKRVEENLHVDFLENKAIEKGTGPNWLFNIDSLTKSMNYVRDALLESPLSNAQDTCKADAPESSENLNPTASTSNPSANQMETLTVETPIPTVSSPVLTACFKDSLEPTTTTRIISKRVTSQNETPSMDTISTLANRFDDILRVTTSTVDSHEEEVDVSNIETTITASPTLTLRIHKDHPKKSKKISDALQDPSWVEAMQEELLQFKIQNVWTLVDCPKGEERIDYDEVFAPVARIKAIRLFLAYASLMRFTVYQMDVKSVFLYGTLDEEVEFEALMHEKFQMSAMGELNFFHGLQVLQKEDDENVVDLLTKPFDAGRFQYLVVEHAMCGVVKGNLIIFTTFDRNNRRGNQDSSYRRRDSTPRVTSLAADEGSMQQKLDELTALCTSLQRQQSKMVSKFEAQELEINNLKARIKLLEDKDGGVVEQSVDDVPIKGRRLDEGEEVAKRVSVDTEEMATVLTSMDAASILTSGGVQVVPTAAEVATASVSIPAGSGVVPTASLTIPTVALIFTTTTDSIPYTRRKGKEKMVESDLPKKKKLQEQIDVQVARELEEEMAKNAQRMNDQIARDAKIARIHAEEELQMIIDGLDRNNETKARHFKGMTLEDIKEKFDPVWKQFQVFIPIGSKEEAERFKRKGVRLEQDSSKKLKTSEEVLEEKLKKMMELIPVEEVYVEALQVKHLIIDWKVHTKGHRSYWKIIRLGGSSASYQFFVDMLKHFDREDLNRL